jgi:serine/threonine protein phosphatase 1
MANDRVKIPNPPGRTFAIGDIHGQYLELGLLTEYIANDLKFNPDEDLLIFLGDYIDRGPNSARVIDILLKIRKLYGKSVYFLKGNHEDMCMSFLQIPGYSSKHIGAWHVPNGGDIFYKNYGLGDKVSMWPRTGEGYFPSSSAKEVKSLMPKEHLEFFEKELSLMVETDDYIFVHAGLMPGTKVENQTEDDILWIRDVFLLFDLDFDKTVVHGHSGYKNTYFRPSRSGTPKYERIGVDTRAFTTKGKLTCLELPSMTTYFIKNQKYRSCKKIHKVTMVD